MSTTDEIKQRIDIVSLVSEYAPLKKVGRNFQGLCPFHTEKTPSFFVFPERQSWHCYGACSTGGDIFTFFMKREGVEFSEALRTLAQRAGVALPSRGAEGKGGEQRLYDALEVAARFYYNLLVNSREGEEARQFIARRGISQESAQKFLLGYSPAGWEGLKGALRRQGFEERELLAGGLVVEREGEGSYDRFRHRLMFPINDSRGRVAGFGARALDDSLPKYINSPQSPVFDKGGTLYGLDKARQGIKSKNQAIIVEGYVDVVIPHQYGYDNVVASMGTSLTQKQADLLKDLASNVLLCLDGDVAGQEATLRSLESTWRIFDLTLLKLSGTRDSFYQRTAQPTLKVMLLPQGKDPDQVVQEDPQLWQALIDKAIGVIDFIFQTVASRQDLTTPEGKTAVVNALFSTIAGVENPFAQEEYFEKLAKLVGVDRRTLEASLPRLRQRRGRRAVPRAYAPQETLPLQSQGDPLEEFCLSLLLAYPELREEGMRLSPEHFLRGENREIFTQWQKEPTMYLTEDTGEVLQVHLAHLRAIAHPPASPRQQELAFIQIVTRLQERRLRELEEGVARARVTGEVNPALDRTWRETSNSLREVFESKQRLEKEINTV